MNFQKCLSRAALAIIMLGATLSWSASAAKAADHRDAPTVDGIPEGDITDVFSFLDPNDPTRLVLIMNVNPFSVPAETPSAKFSDDLLYQFKIDNDGDFREDQVIEVLFTGGGATVNVFGPRKPEIIGNHGLAPLGKPDASGPVNSVVSGGNLEAFAGLRDDPFVTDVGQVFRILNNDKQDVFRAFTSPAIGPMRGRPVRQDGTSGVDGFGGFNVTSIQVEFPKSMVRGGTSEINVWGTVSRPTAETVNAKGVHHPRSFVQFDRMGQQLANTIFVPAAFKDAFNFAIPEHDMRDYSQLIPDSLTNNDPTGNTISARASLLQTIGVTVLPNGAPLLLPAGFVNPVGKDLIRLVVLPDVLRIDLDILPPNDLQVGEFGTIPTVGLQNGRRPGDDVTDILMRLARQLADVSFPPGSGLPGSGPIGNRHVLDCSSEGAGFPQCTDRRVLLVLQGTDFIKPDAQVPDISTSGNDRTLSTSFPFLATPHPYPGDAGTVGFPPQQ